MHESEFWITGLFNDHLAGVGNAFLGLVGIAPEPRPWATYIVMQILTALFLMILFPVLRSRLSVDSPGKFQQTFELIYEFVAGQAEEQVGHHYHKYLTFFRHDIPPSS